MVNPSQIQIQKFDFHQLVDQTFLCYNGTEGHGTLFALDFLSQIGSSFEKVALVDAPLLSKRLLGNLHPSTYCFDPEDFRSERHYSNFEIFSQMDHLTKASFFFGNPNPAPKDVEDLCEKVKNSPKNTFGLLSSSIPANLKSIDYLIFPFISNIYLDRGWWARRFGTEFKNAYETLSEGQYLIVSLVDHPSPFFYYEPNEKVEPKMEEKVEPKMGTEPEVEPNTGTEENVEEPYHFLNPCTWFKSLW